MNKAEVKDRIEHAVDYGMDQLDLHGSSERYKMIRAIAYQAMREYLRRDQLDGLLRRSIAHAENLPYSWKIRVSRKQKEIEEKRNKEKENHPSSKRKESDD